MSLRGWLPPIIWAGVILTGTSLPSSAVPSRVSEFDKILHFSIYAVFAALLTRQLAEVHSRWRAAALGVAIAVVFAAVDEWHQAFIPGRSTELADWQADALGAVVGTLLTLAMLRWRRTSTRPTA